MTIGDEDFVTRFPLPLREGDDRGDFWTVTIEKAIANNEFKKLQHDAWTETREMIDWCL